MNLRFLKTFVTIADAGSLGKACDRLHVSQPAASRQILALEVELDVRLFDRTAHRLQLTAEGEDLVRRSRRLLAEAEALSERARALKSGRSGILRFGCPPQVIEAFAADFLAQHEKLNPEVQLQLIEDASGALSGYLHRGEIHFAQIPAGEERLRWRLLYPTYAVAVFASTHRLTRRRRHTVEVAELAEEPLLLLSTDSQARGWVDAAFNVAHLQPHVAHESGIPHTLIALAAAGRGVAIVPSNFLIPRRAVRIFPVVLGGQAIGRWSSIAWHPQRFLPPYAEQFVNDFVRYAQRADPGRAFTRRAPMLRRPREKV